MRKLSFLFVLFLCLGSAVQAQSFGLRVGANATDARYDRDDNEIETDGETNLMLGIFVNLPIGSDLFTIQPELNYLNKGYSFETEATVAGQSIKFDRTLAYVDLGVLARLNFGADEGLGFYVGAGPQYSYAVSGNVVTTTGGVETDRDVDFESDRLNRGELQFSAVGGVTFTAGLKFFLEGRYNGSFSNQTDFDRDDIRQRSLGINGGVMVPLGG